MATQPHYFMQHLKYIMLRATPATADLETPVLFPASLQHKTVAEQLQGAFGTPISAGFVTFEPKRDDEYKFQCRVSGNSDSLGLSPRPTDAELIDLFVL